MNNKIQQRFDRSIRDAVEECKRVREREAAAQPKRNPRAPMTAAERRAAKRVRTGYRLSLDPRTGATVWGPA